MAQDGVRLVGHDRGHPLLGDRAVVTSSVWFADPNDTWARTLSRFYKLGRHLNWETSTTPTPAPPSARPEAMMTVRRTEHERDEGRHR
jgi:hypothetical protein